MNRPACNVVVLISGNGSNLQALIDDSRRPDCPYRIAAVIANRPGAYGLERAARANIDHLCLDHTRFDGREPFDRALQESIDRYQPELVVLAGFMRILTAGFVRHYQGRMLNIHPSLLPKYRGLHTHQRAIEAGDRVHGVSIHFVTEELDGGPVIAQSQVPILADDTAETLARRIQAQEHQLYPRVVDWYARGHLHLEDNRVLLDDKPLTAPLVEQDTNNDPRSGIC